MNTTQSPATHTPTPWRANESVFSTNGMTELHIGTPESTACVVYVDKAAPYAATQEANAAFIVRACNSHAQLVAALEKLVTEAIHFRGTCIDAKHLNAALDMANAALSAARK